MNGATVLAGALVISTVTACTAAVPQDEGARTTAEAVSESPSTESVIPLHTRLPVCKDTLTTCTSTVRAPNTNDDVEAKLARLCFPLPFDWQEWNANSDYINETFFLCPDTAQLHAYVDPIGWGEVHATSDACGVCIPPVPPGFTYVVTNRRATIPSCGSSECPMPLPAPPVEIW